MANLKSFPEVIAKLKSSGIDVPGQFNKETLNSTVKIPFPNALIGNLEKRFDDKSVMAAFDVFDIRKIPNASAESSPEAIEAFASYRVSSQPL